jgi:hypothetical protein
LNPLQKGSGVTLSNGNLDESIPAGPAYTVLATIGMSSGKWYSEFTKTGGSYAMIGIAKSPASLSSYLGQDSNGWGYYSADGQKYTGGSASAYGATFTNGDVIGVAFDSDAGTLVFYKNGSSQGTAYTGLTSGPYFFATGIDNGQVTANFGQRAFAYTAPSGFKALCTQNLPAPLVTKSNTVFDVALWTGNGSTQNITGLAFSPDLVWVKARSYAYPTFAFDAIRGATNYLMTSSTGAEDTIANSLTSFNSDGFSLGASAYVNYTSNTFVGWAWDAGTSTVTNNSGSISSQVRANPTAGFSVVTWTAGTGVYTVGHGLGVKPAMIIHKCRSNAEGWLVRHVSIGDSGWLVLNSTAAASTLAYGGTNTSTVFYNQDGVTTSSGLTMVAYCFSPVVGYSSFGSYVGNGSGSNDGPFVYTGFRPKWVMVKASSSDPSGGGWWNIIDATRNTYNAATSRLGANSSSAENSSYQWMDLLSNGFKLRELLDGSNVSGVTYIYAAFAEAPLNYSRAR